MPITIHSDIELLALLVGQKKAERLYEGSLTELLTRASKGGVEYVRIAAARELICRAVAEELQEGSLLTSPQLVREYLRILFAAREHEAFIVLYLDSQHHVIDLEELFQGTLTQTVVFPREVVKRCLWKNAAAVIFAHNHPSGIAEPSNADELLTQALKSALSLVDVRVLDHFIVAGNACLSFAERGLL